MTDKLIAATILLFILSMISERMVTFIKLWCVDGKRFLFWVVPKDIDTSTPSDDPATEVRRTRAILAINLTVSILVALVAKASLFDIFNLSKDTDVSSFLGWEITDIASWERFGSIVVGCLLTGSFISLGSKFWHDLLDLLLQVKDLKEKMVDVETYKVNNLKEFDEFMQSDYHELAKKCLEQNKSKIEALAGIEDYFVGLSSVPGSRKPVIILHSSLASGGAYPTVYQGKLESGKIFTVSVETLYGFEMPVIHLESGDSLCSSNFADRPGTACCNVTKNGVKYILTCAHVLTGGAPTIVPDNENGWITNPIPDDTLSEENNFHPVGSWSFGLISNELDVALVQTELDIESAVNIKNTPPVYELGLNGKEVFVNGKMNRVKGFVSGFSEKGIGFQYNGDTVVLKNLILLSKNRLALTTGLLTEGGDSGAMVYLLNDKTALGMVVGGNSHFTYIMPMASILKTTQSKLA